MSLLLFFRVMFISIIFSSLALAGGFGELIIHLKTKDGTPIDDSRLVLAQTPYSAVTNEEGTAHFYLLHPGVYTLQLIDSEIELEEPPSVYVSEVFPVEIDLMVHDGLLQFESGNLGAEESVQQQFSHTVRLRTARVQNKLVGRHTEGFILSMPGAIYTTQSERERTQQIHIRSHFASALGFRVNGFQTTDFFDGTNHLRLPHRAISSVLLQEGGTTTDAGHHLALADIQTREGGNTWSVGGSIRSDKPASWLGGTSYGKHIYDGEISGPIIENQLYIFAAGEYESFDDADPSAVGVPTYDVIKGHRLYDHDFDYNTPQVPVDTVIWKKQKNGPRPYGSNAEKDINTYIRFTAPVNENLRLDVATTFSQLHRNWFSIQYLLSPDNVPRTEEKTWDFNINGIWKVNPQLTVNAGMQYYQRRTQLTNRKLMKSTSYALRHLFEFQTGSTGSRSYYFDNLFYDIGAGYLLFHQSESSVNTFFAEAQYKYSDPLLIKVGLSHQNGTYHAVHIYDPGFVINSRYNDYYGYLITQDYKLKKTTGGLDGAKTPTMTSIFSEGLYRVDEITAQGGIHYLRYASGTPRLKNLFYPTGSDYQIGEDDFEKESVYNLVLPRLGLQFVHQKQITGYAHAGWYTNTQDITNTYVGSNFLEGQSISPIFSTMLGNSQLKLPENFTWDVGGQFSQNDFIFFSASFFQSNTDKAISPKIIDSSPNGLVIVSNGMTTEHSGYMASIKIKPEKRITLEYSNAQQTAEAKGDLLNGDFRAAWLGYAVSSQSYKPITHSRSSEQKLIALLQFAENENNIWIKNSSVFLQIKQASGTYYTPNTLTPISLHGIQIGRPVSEYNSQKTNSVLTFDAKLTKTIRVNRIEAVVFIECTNLFNERNVVQVFPATGRADDNGFLNTDEFNSYSADQKERRLPQYRAHFRNGLMYEPGRELRMGIEVSM